MYTQEKPDLASLTHFGTQGMKWGIRKARTTIQERESALQTKMTKISANKNVNKHDMAFVNYRKQPAVIRVGKTLGKAVIATVAADMLTGNFDKYPQMSKAQILARVSKIAKTTAINTAINESLSISVASKYTESGRAKKANPKGLTREAVIAGSIKAAVTFGPIAARLLGMKVGQLQKERKKNEKVFTDWGANILPAKTSTVVWSNDDYSVIQPSAQQRTEFAKMKSVGKG